MPFPSLSNGGGTTATDTPVKEDDAAATSPTSPTTTTAADNDDNPTPSRTPSRHHLSKVRSKLRIPGSIGNAIGSKASMPTPPRMRRGGPTSATSVLNRVKSTLPQVGGGGGGEGSSGSNNSKTPTKQQEKLARQAQQAAAASPSSIVTVGADGEAVVNDNGGGNNTAPAGPAHSGNTLEEYVLPEKLRMDVSDVPSGNAGMEVIKVSKNGKQQTRRLGIAPNNHAIYITTNKLHPQGRVLGLLKQGTEHHHDAGGGGVALKEVDLSRVVRMQLGQQSRRFVKARSKQFGDKTSTPQSLSIIYRRPASSTKDKLLLVKPITKKGLSAQIVMDAGEDSLDLIIPSKSDFEALTRTLEDLLAFYQEEEPCANPDYAWIQYHLVDMGKSLVGSGGGMGGGMGGEENNKTSCLVNCSDWVTLCRRWNAPVTKAEATAMYRAFCESLAVSNAPTEGLEMFEVVRLLEVLRQRGLEASAAAAQESGKASASLAGEDPRKRLFQRIAKSHTGDDHNPAVSAAEFLDFMHDKQKETDVTLEDVHALFYRLNGHRASPQLEDAVSVMTGASQAQAGQQHQEGSGVALEKEYITWEAFSRYLLLESNDVFDPERASPSDSYMNEPLNNYWINTSHDTYLRRTKASTTDQKQSGKTDLQSYTLALYHGARAIELDVWDGPVGTKDPLVRFGVTSFSESAANKSSSSNSLLFSDVILTISYFLQSEPNSYPIILLIENHCSIPFQEKMASDIEKILGKQNLLFRPDPSAKDTDPLPSPAQLRGKVVIKSKLPEMILGESVVLNDDFDDENRESTPPTFTDYDSEDDIKENVIGFSATGSIKSPTPTKVTAEQLYQTARAESLEATSLAKAAHQQLTDVRHQAQQSQNHADALLRTINMTYEELKKKREEGLDDILEEGTEVELCKDGASKVKEPADHAMEIANAFKESVEESRMLAMAATTEARSETELYDIAREDFTDKEAVLAEAKEQLQDVSKSNRDLEEAAERALSEARTNREYAENAERRVMAVRGLLDRSHNQAVSSETVAGTADAEANISEQRATDAEARAEKARANAESERKKAEKETKLEDDLEAQLIDARRKLREAMDAVNAARERADDAVVQADKLTDEIREAKSMGYDDDASIEDSASIADEKSKQRRQCIGQMEEALTDKLGLEANTRKLEGTIEDLQRKAKLQAKVAASARRQADHSLSIADQLEEHALEEREAANLRQAARVKAKRGVESSDAVLMSTEAQLAEAERAATEAGDLAIASREKAEQLAIEMEVGMRDTAPFEEKVRIAQEIRDAALSIYESSKASKEEALERAARAKQVHETNCVNLANLERDAMAELLHKESVQQAEMLAMTACENAKALSDQVDVLERKHDEAKALATEKSGALEIATRFKEKKKRVQPVSSSLSKLTLLHSSNFRNWDKSFQLPNYAMHSIPDAKFVKRAEQGKEEWKSWVDFNQSHFSRTYPESASRNYNPLLPWALGCQFVSMNFIRNKFMLLNDGRFRENRGKGYVLKPEYLCNSAENANDSINGALSCTQPRKISIRILSGFCLPKSMEKKSSSTLNPFVRVTLYDASPATLLPSPVFKTQVVEGNGLNPVWNTQDVANFSCLNPSVGMLLFACYDHCNVTKTDLFIGASAMPVSCIREGYRCVSLFDSNNTRSGAMKYASLFIKVKIES